MSFAARCLVVDDAAIRTQLPSITGDVGSGYVATLQVGIPA